MKLSVSTIRNMMSNMINYIHIQNAGKFIYLENSHSRPQNVVEMLPITFTVRMLRNDLRTSAFSLLPVVFCELAKLTAEQIHAQDAGIWQFRPVLIYV